METAKKQWIIRQYLQAHSLDRQLLINDETLRGYDAIGDSIVRIEAKIPGLFDMEAVEEHQEHMRILFDIFDRAITLEPGSPPIIVDIDSDIETNRIKFWQLYQQISALPGADYYNRPIAKTVDRDLDALITHSQEKLRPIILSFLPAFDITNQAEVQEKIKSIKKEVESAIEGSPEHLIANQKLAVLNDLNNLNTLAPMSIPQENAQDLTYCTLSETVGGVTNKISLMHRDKVVEQLNHWVASNASTLTDYNEHRNQYKLSTEAILKLPKHGDAKEVQREAMALNISRILHLDTAKSTMVSYQGNPALLVPFEDITLLTEISSGKAMRARLFSTATYTHYSTLNPVGEGLEAERFIEDFGPSLGLFYLCSDTDAVGGRSQNKALRKNHLFIFDQVLMEQDKLGLDSRLSMQPIKLFTKHTRHDQGRNRTLIEDSSMDKKFESLAQLKQEQPKLLQYCAHVSFIHMQKIKALKIALNTATTPQERKELKWQIDLVQSLKDDADILRNKIKERIHKINEIIPQRSKSIDEQLLKHIFILEKLLNIPVLFADDARPYRNPWSQRNSIHVQEVTRPAEHPEHIKIKFDRAISEDVLAMLRRQLGVSSPVSLSGHELIIQDHHLRALTEASLFPEHQSDLDEEQNYLRTADLDVIKRGYGEGLHGKIIHATREYLDIMTNDLLNFDYKLRCIDTTRDILKGYIDKAKDKGFGMHVLKKFQFDVQQKLQRMMPEDSKPTQINLAFSAALKLDQISMFNAVVQEAIKHDKLTDPIFSGFLQACIDQVNQATNHYNAQELSTKLVSLAKTAMQELQVEPLTQSQALVRALHIGETEPDLFEGLDPVADQREMQESEARIINQALLLTPPEQEPIDNELDRRAGIDARS